jgi:hypothetical protein
MLSLTGWTVGEYFHIGCDACRRDVKLTNLRWVGDVPQVEATCPDCGESSDFKLQAGTAKGITPEASPDLEFFE